MTENSGSFLDRLNRERSEEPQEGSLNLPVENESVISAEGIDLRTDEQAQTQALMPSLTEFMEETARGFTVGVRDVVDTVSAVGEAGSGPTGPTLLGTAATAAAEGIGSFLRPVGTEDPVSQLGGMTREFSRFMAGFAVTKGILSTAGIRGTVTNPVLAGFITDLTLYSPYEERLSNLAADLPEGTRLEVFRQVGQFIQADEEDPQAIAVLKQGLEGMLLGGIGEGVARPFSKIASLPSRIVNYARTQRSLRLGRQMGANGTDGTPFPTVNEDGVPTTVDVQAALTAEGLLAKAYGEMGLPDPGPGVGKISIPGFDIEGLSVVEARAKILTNQYALELRPLLDSGQLTREQFDTKVRWFEGQAIKVLDVDFDITGAQVSDRFIENQDNARATIERNAKENTPTIRNLLTETIVDRSGNLRREVLRSGPEGQQAMMMFDLTAGANPKSALEFDRARATIYQNRTGPFSRSVPQDDRDLINQIIAARRLRTVREYRPDTEFTSSLVKTVGEAQALFGHLRDTLGEEKFNELWTRADTFFQVTRQKTDELLEAGVISAAEHERLVHFDYAPLEYLEKLDPVIAEMPGPGGRTISVNSSGISALGEGSEKVLETNFEQLLGQVLFRTNATISRNRANQALLQVAERNDSLVVRTQVPRGERGLYTKISTFVEGERKDFFLRSSLAQEWQNDPVSTHSAVQILTGSAFVRPMATGLNPEFALVNFPRDLMLVWLQSNLYGANILGAGARLAKDLVTVAPDAFLRRGRYDDYINQGGGMNFLTHQGQVFTANIAEAPHGLKQLWGDFQRTAGYLGETTEILTRLAVREREMANLAIANRGISLPEHQIQGTWRARTYLDFAQGGILAKHADSAWPYLNAGVQGIRSFARAGKEDPVELGLKLAQLAGIYGSINLANRLVHPEAWDDVPPEVKANYMVMMTGMSYVDDRGERRHIYYRLPVDHSTAWLNGAVNAIMDSQLSGRPPDEHTIDQIRAGLDASRGIIPGLDGVPAVNAINALVNNVDSFGNEIWRGSDVLSPENKYYTYPSRPTSPLAVDIGNLTSQPPAQLEVAVRSVLPTNIWTNLVGGGYAVATEGIPQGVIDAQMPEFMTMMPFSRRLLGVTHPFTRERETIEGLTTEEADATIVAERQMDEMTFRMHNEPGSISSETVRQFVDNQRGNTPQSMAVAEKLQRRHDDLSQMLTIFERTNYDDINTGLGRSFWFQLQSAPPVVRATSFAQAWDQTYADPSPNDAAARRRVLIQMLRRTPGFDSRPGGQSPEFAAILNEEHRLRRAQGQPTWR